MKKSNVLSIVMSVVMCISMMGSMFSAKANESSDKIYTLEELFAMSDEEFLALEKAEAYYEKINKDTEIYGRISGTLYMKVFDEGTGYKANVTEEKITELLGKTVNYEMDSPVSIKIDDVLYYHVFLFLNFTDYQLYTVTNDDIMEFSKCWYCVDQVMKMYPMPWGISLGSNSENKEVLNGDVNLDKAVNLYDVIWIASDLVDIFKLTEGQQKVGDVNEDGVCDLYDAIAIAKTLM